MEPAMYGVDGGGVDEAADLFPYYQDEGGASPDTISGAADEIERSAGNLEIFTDDVDTSFRPAMTGTADILHTMTADAPKPATNNMSQVLAATLVAAGATRLFGRDGVAEYNTRVDDLRSEYHDRKAEIMSSDCSVAAASHPDGASGKERAKIDGQREDDVAAARESELADLVRELQGRQEDYRADPLDAEADTAAKRLDDGPTDETMIELFAAGALPSTTIDAFPDVDFYFDKLPSDLADMTDEELADFMLDHPDYDATIMLNLEEERPGAVDIMGEKLADKIRDADITWDSDSEVLDKYKTLLQTWIDASPDVTASLYEHLGAEDTLGFLDKLGTVTDDDATDLAYVFRYGLDQADIMWDDDQRAEFGHDLGQAIEDNRATYPPRGYESALSFLLDDNYYSTALLDPLGDKLAELDLGANSWCHDGSMLPHDSDLMSSYFSCLQNNGEAALDFFGDDADRQEYYLKDRDYLSDTGGINNLIGALDAATTDAVNITDSDRQHDAAALVASIAEYLPKNAQATTDYITSDGTVHLAHIITTYMPAVDYYTSAAGDDVTGNHANDAASLEVPGLGVVGDMPVFQKSELGDLVKLAISSEDGFTEMREGVSTYESVVLTAAVDNGSDLQDVANHNGSIEGFFLRQVGDVKLDEAASKDAQAQAWIDLGKKAIGAIPIPGGSIVSTLAGEGVDLAAGEVQDALTQHVTGVLDQLRDHEIPATFGIAKYAMLGTLYDAGAITEDKLHDVAAMTDSNGHPFASQDQVDKWFSDGFPTQDEIDDDSALRNFLNSALGGEKGVIDLEEYEQGYESELTDAFASH